MINPRDLDDEAARYGPAPNPATLEYLLEVVRGAPAAQIAQSDKLDGKTINVFGAATVILGLLASGRPTVHPSHHVFVTAIVIYLVAAVASLAGLWVRPFRVIDNPITLWADLYDVEPHAARWSIMDRLVEDSAKNERTLRSKMITLSIALVATGGEVLLIAIAAVR